MLPPTLHAGNSFIPRYVLGHVVRTPLGFYCLELFSNSEVSAKQASRPLPLVLYNHVYAFPLLSLPFPFRVPPSLRLRRQRKKAVILIASTIAVQMTTVETLAPVEMPQPDKNVLESKVVVGQKH